MCEPHHGRCSESRALYRAEPATARVRKRTRSPGMRPPLCVGPLEERRGGAWKHKSGENDDGVSRGRAAPTLHATRTPTLENGTTACNAPRLLHAAPAAAKRGPEHEKREHVCASARTQRCIWGGRGLHIQIAASAGADLELGPAQVPHGAGTSHEVHHQLLALLGALQLPGEGRQHFPDLPSVR